MKRKDIITLVISVGVFIVVLGLLYRYLFPTSQNSGIQVEVPRPVVPTFNEEQLNTLKNDVTNYNQNLTPQDNGGGQPIIQ